jgi:hypothetical protein
MNKTVLPQPPYSPDLASADFFLFPKLKSTLKGRQFQTIRELMENSQMELHVIPKKAYQDCFQKCSGIGSSASMQEKSTLKAIRLTQLQASPKKL